MSLSLIFIQPNIRWDKLITLIFDWIDMDGQAVIITFSYD
jgi:hypothetical protein